MADDIFTPAQEPARSIHRAIQNEAQHRANKPFEEWNRNEIHAVLMEASRLAPLHNLLPPTLEDVQKAEVIACGHCDYPSQWALAVVETMKAKSRAAPPNSIPPKAI